jgi:hypothetical protein
MRITLVDHLFILHPIRYNGSNPKSRDDQREYKKSFLGGESNGDRAKPLRPLGRGSIQSNFSRGPLRFVVLVLTKAIYRLF